MNKKILVQIRKKLKHHKIIQVYFKYIEKVKNN